jgi:hypothetical protein
VLSFLANAPPPAPPPPPDCGFRGSYGGGGDGDFPRGLSPQCDAFFELFESLTNNRTLAQSCPANFGADGSVAVLSSFAATQAPPIRLPLSRGCSAALGLPPATTSPVARVAAAVTLAGVTAAQFTPALQAAFTTATAAALNVSTSDIIITSVTDAAAAPPPPARRRRSRQLRDAAPGVTVAFTVAAPTTESVATLSDSIDTLSTTQAASFAESLQAGGVATSGVAAAARTQALTPPPAPPAPAPPGAASGARCAAAVKAALPAIAAMAAVML